MRNRLWLLIVLISAAGIPDNSAHAQDTVWNVPLKGKLDSINSAILQQKRFIEVFIPDNYKPGSANKYDVLYVLDGGNWNTGPVARAQRFLEGEGFMPSTIIVSVMGIDRNKDLTPTHLENWKNSGGGENFLGYIKNELIPYVNKIYPTSGDNTIWGHSLSGMFVVYALLNEPSLFKSYIAVDPSIWWDNCLVAKMAATKLNVLPSTSAFTLFISGREGAEFKDMKIDSMDLLLKKFAPANLNWKIVAYPDETHSSVRFKSIYDGLKFTYAGLGGEIEFHPMNGILLKDKPVKVRYFDDITRLHYTVDGSEPTRLSPPVQREFFLADNATVTYKRLSNRSKHDKSFTGTFATGKMIPAGAKPKNIIPGGFNYSYYEGEWETWPELKNVKPTLTGITDKDFDLDKLPRKKNYALLIDGMLEAKEEGYYLFIFQADKHSKMYVGNKLLMEWDGNYNRRTYSYIVPLAKGFHPFRIEYLHRNEDFKLSWVYLAPSNINSNDPVPIPSELQYHRKY